MGNSRYLVEEYWSLNKKKFLELEKRFSVRCEHEKKYVTFATNEEKLKEIRKFLNMPIRKIYKFKPDSIVKFEKMLQEIGLDITTECKGKYPTFELITWCYDWSFAKRAHIY